MVFVRPVPNSGPMMSRLISSILLYLAMSQRCKISRSLRFVSQEICHFDSCPQIDSGPVLNATVELSLVGGPCAGRPAVQGKLDSFSMQLYSSVASRPL
jgi:hypothetical protein